MTDINKFLVSERIKKVRKDFCQMTQVDFGIALNPEKPVRQSTAREWETGKILPSTERIIRIAKLGNVTVPWLLFGEDEDNLQNHYFPKSCKLLESSVFKNLDQATPSSFDDTLEKMILNMMKEKNLIE